MNFGAFNRSPLWLILKPFVSELCRSASLTAWPYHPIGDAAAAAGAGVAD